MDRGLSQHLLRPRRLLLLGPAAPGSRVGRSREGLTRHAAPGAVVHLDTRQPPAALRAQLRALPPGEAPGVLCQDVEADTLLALLDELARLGVGLLALGSGTTGPVPDLVRRAREAGLRVLGPGAYGPFLGSEGLYMNPLPELGSSALAVLTHSGNVLLSAVAEQRRLAGTAPLVGWGLGRSADLGAAEAVRLLAADPEVTAIALHVEGARDGRALLRAVAEASRRVPVLVMPGGTSEPGQAAALTHTGALGASPAVLHGLLAQAGAQVVARADDWLPVGLALSVLPPCPVRRPVVAADGGGHGALAVDALAAHGVPVPALDPATGAALSALLGADAEVGNPVDLGMSPVAAPGLALRALGILLEDPQVDCVVAVGVIGAYGQHFDDPAATQEEVATAAEVAALARRLGKPLVLVSAYALDRPPAYRVLWDLGVPVLPSIEAAATVLAALRRRHDRWRRHDRCGGAPDGAGFPDVEPEAGGPRLLDEPSGRAWLRDAGLDTGWCVLAGSADQAAAAMRPGARYALKVVSDRVVHKSDVGGVRLDVRADTAAQEYAALLAEVAARAPGAVVDGARVDGAPVGGVLVTPMAGPGVEVLVGAHRDPQYGPLVAVGSGGVLAELLQDTGFRAAPLTVADARELVDGTLSARLLAGYRGRPAVDRDALVRLVVRLGEVVARHPELHAVDLNPVVVTPDGAAVVDVRVVLGSA